MAELTPTELREVETLVARLQDDDVQRQIRPGFERDFTNSILEQWFERRWLSVHGRNGKRSQVEILREIVGRCEDRTMPKQESRRSSRRYEGFHGPRD